MMSLRDVRSVPLTWTVLLLANVGLAEPVPANLPCPQAIDEVRSGKRSTANAVWWGFNAQDSTRSIQSAIDSGAKTVIVPYVGAEWVVTPLRLRSNLELIFEPGVVVSAKKGEFKGKGDSLMVARDLCDLTLRGYGATLKMRKKDYQGLGYAKAEWRMCLDLMGCSRVQILGLRLESSGGDGIYLGCTSKQPYCQDVVIRDVVCHDHHRQGISIIGAKNLLIENCTLSGTSGTSPKAGIDFEPNGANERLSNCVVRNCIMEGNSGAGILVYLKNLKRQSGPVSILVENCLIRQGKDTGIGVGALTDDGPAGLIEFRHCAIEDNNGGGIFVYDKSVNAARVRFVNCKWTETGAAKADSRKKVRPTAQCLLLMLMRPKLTRNLGGIDFEDCYVYDALDRPALAVEDSHSNLGIRDLRGRITVINPHGAKVDYKCKTTDVDLKVIEAPR